jgi:hypothetical protein
MAVLDWIASTIRLFGTSKLLDLDYYRGWVVVYMTSTLSWTPGFILLLLLLLLFANRQLWKCGFTKQNKTKATNIHPSHSIGLFARICAVPLFLFGTFLKQKGKRRDHPSPPKKEWQIKKFTVYTNMAYKWREMLLELLKNPRGSLRVYPC